MLYILCKKKKNNKKKMMKMKKNEKGINISFLFSIINV